MKTYSEALELAKQGRHIARVGWNGKGQFVFFTEGRDVPLETFSAFKNGNSDALLRARKDGTHSGETVRINPHLDMVAADGSIVVGWTASQTDQLANDWMVLS
jgi:hypothetical protein